MKTSGSSTKAGKIKGVAVLVGGLFLLVALHGIGKRTTQRGSDAPPTMASETSPPSAPRENSGWKEAYGKLPLSFEENQGQISREVRYVSHGNGYELFLAPQEVVLALQQSLPGNLSALHRAAYFRALRQAHMAGRMTVLRMGLEGANSHAKISGINQLPGKVNYFLGNKPERWRTNIPTYSQVKYEQVYPGVDLVFYGNQRDLEYDFVVAPGADPKAIALTLKGARRLSIDSKGDLILSMADGQLIFQKPVLYQNVGGQRKQVEGRYALTGKQRVTFAVSEYDRTEPLIIDPVLNYSTYLGGSATGDSGSAIAVDSLGDAFVTGTTFSIAFPTKNGFGAGNAKGVAFVTELNPSGTALLYSTYLGGTGGDVGIGITLDTSSNIYVAGETFSTDFPTNSSVTPFKPTSAGAALGTSFVTKLNPTASVAAQLVYSSYLGGTNGTSGIPDFANAIAADANGNAYVTGYTASSPGSGAANFPITTASAFQTTLGSPAGNACLTKIDTAQSGALSLIYSTYLGGNGADAVSSTLGFGDIGFGLALDSSKNVYIAGTTTSTNFPTTTNAFQPNTVPPAAVAKGTAFLSRIDTTLSSAASLVYSTYLGGNVAEFGTAIAVKPNSTVAYVTGTSSSPTFPTFPANTFQTALTTVFPAAFVSLLDTSLPAGTALQYSTFLGGSNTTGFGIQADTSGNAYVGGGTQSSAFPVSKGAFQTAFASGATSEGFVSKLNPGGKGAADLVYSTLFGGSGSASGPDDISGIAIDTTNDAFITGVAFSSAATFPVFPPATAATPAFQTSLPAGDKSAAFVAKLTLIPTVVITPSPFDFGSQPVGVTSTSQTFTLVNNTNVAVTFTSIATAGVSPAANTDFAVATDACSPSVAAGAQCTVNVTFKPGAAGLRTGTLTFKDSDSSSPQIVNLTGTGSPAAPGVGLAPTSLTFGGQLLTTTSAAQTVTLTNTGGGPLTINSIAASGDFAETSTGATACPISPMTLAPGTNCTISVTFAPTALGARSGTLMVTDNAGGSPQSIPLSGSGWDFSLAGPTATQTVSPSTPLNFNVTMKPLGGFNQPVGLACAIVPTANTTCMVVSPVTATDGMTAQNAQVTVTTTAMMVPPRSIPDSPLSIRQAVPLILALMLLLLLPSAKRLRLRLGMVAAVLMLIVLAGCSTSSKPPVSATLTITGTSNGSAGSVTHKATVTLSVK